jgi:spermidine/putrescine transport system substrate-binding protein
MSTTILGYNDEKMKELGVPTDTWAAIFDPKYLEVKGRVTVLDSANELFAAALKYRGYSANDVDPKHWDEAAALIKGSEAVLSGVQRVVVYQADGRQRLAGSWLLERYLPGQSRCAGGRRKFRILQGVPKEGAVLAVDNMVIHRARRVPTSPTVHELHARGQELSRAYQPHRLATNTEAIKTIKPELLKNPAIFSGQRSAKSWSSCRT